MPFAVIDAGVALSFSKDCGIFCIAGHRADCRRPACKGVCVLLRRSLGRSLAVIARHCPIGNVFVGLNRRSVGVFPNDGVRVGYCFKLRCIFRIFCNGAFCRIPAREGIAKLCGARLGRGVAVIGRRIVILDFVVSLKRRSVPAFPSDDDIAALGNGNGYFRRGLVVRALLIAHVICTGSKSRNRIAVNYLIIPIFGLILHGCINAGDGAISLSFVGLRRCGQLGWRSLRRLVDGQGADYQIVGGIVAVALSDVDLDGIGAGVGRVGDLGTALVVLDRDGTHAGLTGHRRSLGFAVIACGDVGNIEVGNGRIGFCGVRMLCIVPCVAGRAVCKGSSCRRTRCYGVILHTILPGGGMIGPILELCSCTVNRCS